MPQCKQCHNQFTIYPDDKEFYQRISVPEPTLCPDCRRQRRLVHRNERFLYQRICDFCRKPIISQYHPDLKIKVYCRNCWWSDQWNPLDYAVDYDFNKSFFTQWHELILKTPQLALLDLKSDNSEYTHLTSNNKSCYLIFSSDFNEQCYYSNWLQHCQNCIDCFHINNSEQSYQSFFGKNLYHCQFLIKCFSAIESNFCYDCRNIQNCTLCYNLRNKQYYFLNKSYTKEEYLKQISNLRFNTRKGQEEILQKFKELIKNKAIHSFRNQLGRIENSSGDYLFDVKNCNKCYVLNEAENCSYVCNMQRIKDSYDCEFGGGGGEFGYENTETYPMPNHSIGIINSYGGNDNFYTFSCMNAKFVFGCACLKKLNYCIFNKQYSEQEYMQLTGKIISQMINNNEWGQAMPIKYSMFGYNETNAQDYFPLNKDQVINKGWFWRDEAGQQIKKQQNNIDIFKCQICQKIYNLIPQEIEFYKKNNLPLPVKCYQCRYEERLNWRNKNILNNRQCSKCKKQIQSTYSSDRLEKVYCNECYQQEIY